MIRNKVLAAAAMQLHATGNFLGAMQTALRIESEAGARLILMQSMLRHILGALQ